LITGASGGIGSSCVKRLSQNGIIVAAHYRNENNFIKEFKKDNFIETFQYDLLDPNNCEKLINAVIKKFRKIDILINNAGINIDNIALKAKEKDFDDLLNINLKSTFLLSKFASKHMLKNKYGRIINITSVIGHISSPGQGLYAASKAALTAITKTLAIELAKANILVNAIAPGFIETSMTANIKENIRQNILKKIPIARFGMPDDISGIVNFLISKDADYITGTTIHANGGIFMN
jgi:3-oxoacyl-[acyl-carrier protein] reductase